MADPRDRSSLVTNLLAVAVIASGLSNAFMYLAMSGRVESERAMRQEATTLLERCLATAERSSEP